MADEIEFLDAGPAEGPEELLPQPTRRRLPGSPRSRGIALVVLAVVLAGGGLILRAATDGSPGASPPTATAQRTPPPSEVSTSRHGDSVDGLSTPAQIFCGSEVRGVPSGGPSSVATPVFGANLDPRGIAGLVTCTSQDVADCPEYLATAGCTTTGEIPMAVVDAVRARFPGAQYLSSQSQVLDDPLGLWYRYMELRLPRDHVTVQVLIQQQFDDAGLSGNLDNGNKLIVRSVHNGADLATIVQVTSPSGTRPDDAVGAALAADPRLAAVG